jgi:glycosyltransferase involved in cell wall biosynthesis
MIDEPSIGIPAAAPLRFVFLAPAAQMGGAERSLLDLISSLRQCGHPVECHLILPLPGPLDDAARKLGVTVHHVAMPQRLLRVGDSRTARIGRMRRLSAMGGSILSLFGYVRRLRGAIAQIGPDIVHSNGLKTHIMAALTCPKTAMLGWHMRDFISGRPAVSRLLKLLAKRTSVIVAISQAVATDVRQMLPGANVVTILNAIDTCHFTSGHEDGAWLDRIAGFEPSADALLRVGLVATYARWKGQDIFLAAIAGAIASTQRAMRFFVVGGAIYDTAGSQFSENELRKLAAQAGVEREVGFVPFQSDPLPVYRSLDVLVHASTRPEPFGRTIAEAMACGKAIIVSRSGGAAELFEEGTDAVGFPPGDAEALAKQIARLAGDDSLRSAIAARARASAESRFDRARLGPELLQAYGKSR